MTDLIQQHLQAVEVLQSDLEERIRQALGDVDANDILERADELPGEIADELRAWIEAHLLAPIVEEAVRFLEDIDTGNQIQVDEAKIRTTVGLLLDHYIAAITIAAQAAFSHIQNQALLQQDLGRSPGAITADITNKVGLIGSLFKGFENGLVTQTDSFVNSAAGAVILGSSEGNFTWIVVLDGKECRDCHGRHGQSAPYADWVEEGLPRTGWSVCGQRCRCILVPGGAFARNSTGPVQRSRR